MNKKQFWKIGIITILMVISLLIILLAVSAIEIVEGCKTDDDCRTQVKNPECAHCASGKCFEAWCSLYCEHGYVPNTCGCQCRESPCVPKWKCTKWSRCIDEERTRECTDIKECGTDEDKPIESRPCRVSRIFKFLMRFRKR
ncbi:hypothetical protein KY317_03555 [Candidatus Woesearchaeota archaeon]|nr:hypothetical protein [Candidatus Woesearchaeota archaeon]